MSNLSNDVYKETYYALTENDTLLELIPSNILAFIKERANSSSMVFDFLNEDESILQLSKNALELYTYLMIKYGNLNADDKERIRHIVIQNSIDKADLVVDSFESYINSKIDNEIIGQVKADSEETINQYLSKDDIGYENELYLEMKKRLDELEIDWEPYPRDVFQRI